MIRELDPEWLFPPGNRYNPPEPGEAIAPAALAPETTTPLQWGRECARGFVSNSRFASSATEQVIPRTNRAAQRKRNRT